MKKIIVIITLITVLLCLVSCGKTSTTNEIDKLKISNLPKFDNAYILSSNFQSSNAREQIGVTSYEIIGSSIYIDGYIHMGIADGTEKRERREYFTDMSNVILYNIGETTKVPVTTTP